MLEVYEMNTLDYEVCKSQYDKLTDKGKKICDIIIMEHEINEKISELGEETNKLLEVIEARMNEKKKTTITEKLLLYNGTLLHIISLQLKLVSMKLNQINIRLYRSSRQQKQQKQQEQQRRSKGYTKRYSGKQYKKRYRKY